MVIRETGLVSFNAAKSKFMCWIYAFFLSLFKKVRHRGVLGPYEISTMERFNENS